ncbi:hypothetical protein BV22DRAFT_1092243 [Leucogyrophana mollusca]|uniref:Uncharacterized protein n=1 Tax=Leucogyrophana mollusca TaxID=85980 RepID=A0ACB8BFX0_9AGAM|nr:hypothetical protein BV22DRAFT_1092243 [Leucogyrophana mollusca]
MSGFTSFFPTKFLPSMNPRDRPSDPLSRLRFALETMPGSRKYVFTPATRAEILSELYDAFWGPYSHLFLPLSNSSLPMHATLSDVQSELSFAGAGSEEPIIPGRPCGHIFSKGESCFRCKDCALDDSCVLCSRCFHASDHSDHNVSFFIAQQSGGCCDCGDAEAWRAAIGCPFHPPSENAPDPVESSQGTSQATPKVTTRSILETEIPPVQNYPYRVSFPPELREIMGRTVAYALDFLLDTLDYSPDEPSVPADEAELRLQPTADPMQKDQYCIVLWNDDKHSFSEVIELICETTTRTRDEAHALAHSIDELGREIIDMNTNVTRLLEVAQIISKIELGITIRRAYDTFREQVAVVIIEWLLDLTRSRLGADTLIIKEVIAAELLSTRKRENTHFIFNAGPQVPDIAADVSNPCRIDWLFLYHTRLWKKPRISLKEIYASVLTLSHAHKIAIAGHFASVYHRVVDAYLLVDREAETSIKYFALQLFTVPSVASHIVLHHDLVTRLLDIIINFFTNQIADKRIQSGTASTSELDVESAPFKSKRFMPVFSDLRYLCHNEPVQQLIARHNTYIRKFAKVCQLFMCVNPNKRAARDHVEYETDAWISVFNVTLSLSRVIKVYGEAFSWASPAQLIGAITIVMRETLAVCTLGTDRLDKNKFSVPAFHEVTFGDVGYQIVDFDVLEGWVSFHHSLHWLLAELLKHVDTLAEESLMQVGVASVRDLFMKISNEQSVLTVIDFPLRVLAMIAQIRAGLWVRNGFPIRGQLLHYRDFMLRELCYDQDLYIVQTSLIILDPNTVIVSVLDRFGLLDFFRGAVVHPTYEGAALSSMIEEVLYVLITLLSEKSNASKMPLPVAVRREIVHALAMGPCSFTDLVKRVAERMVDDICFERVLKEVSHFRVPEATTDTGVYELKDEAYDEVNPFFYHYTRNKREEVEAVLKARLRKKTGLADPVIVPKPLDIDNGPFSILSSALESEALLQVIFFSIYNILVLKESTGSAPPSGEAILDQAFHLIMLALVERASVFSYLSAVKGFEDGKNLIDIICALEHEEDFKTYKARVEWILEQISKVVPEEVQARRKVVDADVAIPDPESAKKKAAKARQEAIMAQMKAQQASFAINFDEDDEESEEMEETPEELLSYGTCIVCQEDLTMARAFGTLGLLQPSRLLRNHPDSHSQYLNEIMQMSPSLDRPIGETSTSSFPPPEAQILDAAAAMAPNFDAFPLQHTRFGLHSSVCGHMMHLDCFQVYSTSIRHRHRSHATRNHPEKILRKEFICPLCKSLGNVVLPVSRPSTLTMSSVPFPDWIRASGISILKSKPDAVMDALQFRNGTGEFVFWSAQDQGYSSSARRTEGADMSKMLDTVMNASKVISQQTRHLRERAEPEPGERGVGIYLPEELVGYTIASLEVAIRGSDSGQGIVADSLTEPQSRMVRGLLTCLARLGAMELEGRPDGGRESIKQAIIKRLLPEWSRTSLTSYSYPLLLRDPFAVLVETAAVAPEMLQHVLILTYYACLARTVVGMVYVLNKARQNPTVQPVSRNHVDLFGDVRMFFMSVVRHSPVFEHTATLVFETFGEARIERLLYAFTLPFLRRAAILCRAVIPLAFPTPTTVTAGTNEYKRLLATLGIPPLSDLPNQDTLQNALSGWCAHYGHSHAASQLNCGVVLELASVYRIARLPLVLDNLFGGRDKVMRCARCNTVPVDAAICLICGTTCCMLSHCCSDPDSSGRGECNTHTRECGGAIGLYFVVKRCSLLYLYANDGTFTQSPYLDVHGEVDVSMRRGRRQYLHPARWEDIRRTWLNHGIPTVIARKLESTVDSGGWETL